MFVSLLFLNFGLRGEEAGKYLKDNPLVLSPVDVKILDEAIQKYHANKIKSDYEKDSDKSWSDLTSNQQTVITSVGFQYGNMKFLNENMFFHFLDLKVDFGLT